MLAFCGSNVILFLNACTAFSYSLLTKYKLPKLEDGFIFEPHTSKDNSIPLNSSEISSWLKELEEEK